MAQLRQELSLVLEIDAQHDRDAEDELSMRDGIKDVVGDVFPEHSINWQGVYFFLFRM